jgi:serine-type D-Ala-D-Ala carboxypeptidase (penicillin-binding protein 5/6)
MATLIWFIPIAAVILWPSAEADQSALSSSTSSLNLPPIPVQVSSTSLSLSATSFVSLDINSGKFLLEKNADSLHAPASTTKLVLSWVTLRKCSPNLVVAVTESFKQGAVLGLNIGERFTIHDLLYAALLPSDNDAAVALADGCFGSQSNAVTAMNRQAIIWKLSSTHFANTNGLDNEGNYSTAHDLAQIGKLTMTDPLLSDIVTAKNYTISSLEGKYYYLKTTNQILGTFGVSGIKTGSTDFAGENFIGRASIDGHIIVTVVLGSSDRFVDTKKLLLEITRIYRWEVEPGVDLTPVRGGSSAVE